MDNFLLNPNVAYLLLVGGIVLALLAALAPGTGLIEALALLGLLLAGGVIFFGGLMINLWAVLLLMAVGPLFWLAVRKPRQFGWLAASILALVIGSAYLFPGTGWLPGVDPLLALIISLAAGLFFWFAARKTLEARLRPATHNLETLIGERGEARTEIRREGSVLVGGEMWSARSADGQIIPPGTLVRIHGRDGLILLVQPEPRLRSE